MGLLINQNLPARNAYNNLSITDSAMSKSLEKLSSGYRINRAADDAAGLSVSEGLRAQIGGLKVAVRNAQDGISVVQTAEGALTEVHSILQRMRDLSVQASNSGSQDISARSAAHQEVTQLNAELDRIGGTTRFGGQTLLNGTAASTSSQVTLTNGAATLAGSESFSLTGTFTDSAGKVATPAGAAGTLPAPGATHNTTSPYQRPPPGAPGTALPSAPPRPRA